MGTTDVHVRPAGSTEVALGATALSDGNVCVWMFGERRRSSEAY